VRFTTPICRTHSPLQKSKEAAVQWLRGRPSAASWRNALLVLLCELRLERQRNGKHGGEQLAHQALAEFDVLPPDVQAELNGTVWLESARLSIARELIDLDRVEELPALLTEVVGTAWRTLAAGARLPANGRSTRRASRAFAPSRPTSSFPAAPGVLSAEDLRALCSRIGQLVVDRHEDPHSLPLNLTLGRAYARLAEHYLASGQPALASPPARAAASPGHAALIDTGASRRALISRMGGCPKKRLYSRLNWLTLS